MAQHKRDYSKMPPYEVSSWNLHLPNWILRALDKESEKRGISRVMFTESVITSWLEKHGHQQPRRAAR